MKWLMIAAIFLLMASSAQANDSAVETAVGGLKLRKEHSVLMEKERLFISEKLVRVEYEFRNTSNEDVISEVAFPIPPYEYDINYMGRDFPDFKAWVDGKPFQVKKEVRAYIKDRDVSHDLRQTGITIENFGDFEPDNNNQIKALKPEMRNRLSEKASCNVNAGEPGRNNYFSSSWVSYILTTANTWQTPIKDFELIIQGEKDDLVSFCWDGPVEKTGDAQLRARKTDFVPATDLKVYFFRFWFN